MFGLAGLGRLVLMIRTISYLFTNSNYTIMLAISRRGVFMDLVVEIIFSSKPARLN